MLVYRRAPCRSIRCPPFRWTQSSGPRSVSGTPSTSVGCFTNARPAGAETVPRSNFLAYDLSTGELLNPTTIRAKVWLGTEPEPDAWTIEVPHQHANTEGSPGLFGFTPQEQRAWIDNVEVKPN